MQISTKLITTGKQSKNRFKLKQADCIQCQCFNRGGGQGLKASEGTLKLCFFFKKKTGRCFESGMTHFITGCWMTSKFAPIVGAGLRTDEVSLLHDMYSTSENPGDFLWSAGVYLLSCRRTSFESL